LTYDTINDKLTLWLPPQRSPREILYVGPVLTPEVAFQKYELDHVSSAADLPGYLAEYIKLPGSTIFVLSEEQTKDLGCREISDPSVRSLVAGKVDSTVLMPTINACRAIKSNQEIEYIKKANEITALAHIEILKNVKKMSSETVAEAVYTGTCLAAGAKRQAYDPIIASGENASTLHYTANDEAFGNRKMLLIDAGCEWECYACDVTRTFPISGEYTPESKAIYKLVETMQESCIAHMLPGVLFRDVNLLAHTIAVSGLLQLGILKGGSITELLRQGLSAAFMPHGLGHHLGLETHDVEDTRQPMISTVRRPFGLARKATPLGEPSTASLPFAYNISVSPWEEYNGFTHDWHELFAGITCHAPVRPDIEKAPGLRPGMVVTVEPGL
jgi:Xaa-Pro dipeptidase